MWSAIKSDLYEFISTVQEDAQGTISKVVDIPSSRTPEEEAKITEEDRILSQFRNDITTFSEDVKPEQKPEFEKFYDNFSLSSNASDIGYILEEEEAITRFHDKLVPSLIPSDLFWARYFFKLNILIHTRLNCVLESAYDEEEELTWGEDDDVDNQVAEKESVAGIQDSTCGSTENTDHDNACDYINSSHGFSDEPGKHVHCNEEIESLNAELSRKVLHLEDEIEKLQNQLIVERTTNARLKSRIANFEDRELNMNQELAQLRAAVTAAESKNQTAPLSGASSIVDLGQAAIPNEKMDSKWNAVSNVNKSNTPSDLSLASLQSLSSGDSTPVVDKDVSVSRTENKNFSTTLMKEGEEEEEEEWDDGAWE